MNHIAKKNWTAAEHEMVDALGYTGRTAKSQVALSRQEKFDRAADAAFDRAAGKTMSRAESNARDNQ